MEFKCIKEIFESVDITSLVVLTYELDISVISNICLALNNRKGVLAPVKPVIFYDARKTKESLNAPPVFDLLPYKKSGGKHHSKAYLFTEPGSIHLILGSFNLTEKGFLRNKEVFKHFTWSEKQTENITILDDFINLLETPHYKKYESRNLNDSLEIVRLLREGINGKSQYRLLHSGYDSTGITYLKKIWKEKYPENAPEAMYVISPFFDLNGNNIIKSLEKENLLSPEINIITSRGRSEKLPITKEYYNDTIKYVTLNIYESDTSINPGNEEWTQIVTYGKMQGLKIKDTSQYFRDLHSKIMVISRGNTSLVYFGSANFTRNAWTGRNCELGLTVWIETPLDELYIALNSMYNVMPGPVSISALCDSIDMDDTGDDYKKMSCFPEFISNIYLEKTNGDTVRFKVAIKNANIGKSITVSVKIA